MGRLNKILLLLFVLALFLGVQTFVFGQSSYTINDEVRELNKQIKDKRDKIEELQNKRDEYSKALRQKQSEKISLSNQLAILDNRTAKAELDIEETEIEIDRTDLEIRKINLEVKEKEDDMEREKANIGALLRLIYKRDQVNALEILLLNNSFSEFLSQVRYLEDMNKELSDSLDALEKYKKQLERERASLEEENVSLEDLKEELENRKLSLGEKMDNKLFILNRTKSSENEFQRLLELARQEQEEAAADITNLERSVRARIAQTTGEELSFNDAGFIWPVLKNTITSYFHDPDYPFRYIFEHPAIDIRSSQGTPLKAAASGYVARARDGGSGYSYIMIVHGDGLATVYSHVSKIYVTEDEYVVQGQTIGLSGGLPGTPGAGRLTTGPHLHFEVRLNGIPVNPLEYLP